MDKTIKFAVFLPQTGLSFEQLLGKADLVEEFGYHSLWLVDHMWTPVLPEEPQLECMAAMSALAARTKALRLGTLVLCNSYRNPALLAKSLATIDQISNGRLEVGLGAGWAEEEYRAYGYPFPPIGVRLKQLEDGLNIVKAMFADGKATYRGAHHSVVEAICNPKPIQRPHPPITVGGAGEKVLLRLVAQYADRWNCPAGEDFARKAAVLKEHCESLNRPIDSLDFSQQLMVCLGETQRDVDRIWESAKNFWPFSVNAVVGTPERVIEGLRERIASGVRTFTIFFADLAKPETMKLFAKEVMPAFRSAK